MPVEIGDLVAPAWRDTAREMLSRADAEFGQSAFATLALALRSARLARSGALEEQAVEVVWSGPRQTQSTFRRTDRVWVDLIELARAEVWIASYLVGAVDRIEQSLLRALDRGVAIRVLVERREDCAGSLQWNGFERFDERILRGASIYHWPSDRRDLDDQGRLPLMHAKAIVVDRDAMFVTSANLSDAALQRNIEVGVVVRGGAQPAWLAGRLDALVTSQQVQRLDFTDQPPRG